MNVAPTDFAPAERADESSIASDAQLVNTIGLFHEVTNAVPCVVLILNKQRQIIYTNQILMDILGTHSDTEVLGKRPGELLDCIRAKEHRGGCGTSTFCSQCGAVKAILKSQTQRIQAVEECRILTNGGDAFEFRVWATPYTLEDKEFTVFSLIDLADEKRRQVFERTFFHDANNILSAIMGYSDLLSIAEGQEEIAESIEAIKAASSQLVEEIASHRRLLEAESGKLSVDISRMNSLSVLRELAKVWARHPNGAARTIAVTQDSEDVEFTSDKALLHRVLGNMLRNALEATSAGATVNLACTRSGPSIVFSVRNPGCMPRSTQLQLFQRSFSTKGAGRGIGCFSMKLFGEKYLNGKVWFSTSEDQGTTFNISIPLVFPED